MEGLLAEHIAPAPHEAASRVAREAPARGVRPAGAAAPAPAPAVAAGVTGQAFAAASPRDALARQLARAVAARSFAGPSLQRCPDCAGTCHDDTERRAKQEARAFGEPPSSKRVLARMPAYRPRPSWATRDPSQAPEACEPVPQDMAEDKWWFWSRAFPAEAERRCGCPEVGPVWRAYFEATGSPRFVWNESSDPTSCVITSLKGDDDHRPVEDVLMATVQRTLLGRRPQLLQQLVGQSSVRIPLSSAGITGAAATPVLELNTNIRVGGQLFGGVGASEYGPDTRRVDGFVELEKVVDPNNRLFVSLRPRFELNWHITDAVDFCPGNTGERASAIVRIPVLNLSWLEGSGMARDIYVEANYTRIRHDVPWGPFPNPDFIDPNPVITIPSQALFDFGSDRLRPEAAQALIAALGTAPSRADASQPVRVTGHTDSKGSRSFNQDLSLRRAETVAELLVETYPNLAGRVVSDGFGEDQPVAPNEIEGRDNPAGRALNRRVEIQFGVRTFD